MGLILFFLFSPSHNFFFKRYLLGSWGVFTYHTNPCSCVLYLHCLKFVVLLLGVKRVWGVFRGAYFSFIFFIIGGSFYELVQRSIFFLAYPSLKNFWELVFSQFILFLFIPPKKFMIFFTLEGGGCSPIKEKKSYNSNKIFFFSTNCFYFISPGLDLQVWPIKFRAVYTFC